MNVGTVKDLRRQILNLLKAFDREEISKEEASECIQRRLEILKGCKVTGEIIEGARNYGQ